jgi:hypothetical protein
MSCNSIIDSLFSALIMNLSLLEVTSVVFSYLRL